MPEDGEVLRELKEIRNEMRQDREALNDFKVVMSTGLAQTSTRVDHIEMEKTQLFTFANEAKDAIGMLRGAGIAISFSIMIGGFFLAYMTYQNSMIKPEKAKIVSTQKRENLDN